MGDKKKDDKKKDDKAAKSPKAGKDDKKAGKDDKKAGKDDKKAGKDAKSPKHGSVHEEPAAEAPHPSEGGEGHGATVVGASGVEQESDFVEPSPEMPGDRFFTVTCDTKKLGLKFNGIEVTTVRVLRD